MPFVAFLFDRSSLNEEVDSNKTNLPFLLRIILSMGFEKLVYSSPDKVLEIADDFLFTVLIRTTESKGYTDFD